jgi:hypothetical protein
MAKKVVATLQDKKTKKIAKVITTVRSPKTGAYVFRSQIMMADEVPSFIKATYNKN